jgi:hypothetical protein
MASPQAGSWYGGTNRSFQTVCVDDGVYSNVL